MYNYWGEITDRDARVAVRQGSEKELRAMETYEKQKIVTN